MIAATILAIWILFGGGGGLFGDLTTRYMEDPMKDTIVEEARREQALDELDSLQDAIKDFNKNLSKDIKQFDKLVKNYDSTPEAFDQMVSDSFVRRQQEMDKIWKQRSEMLIHIKPDEWQAIISGAKAEAVEDNK